MNTDSTRILNETIFHLIRDEAFEMNVEAYVIGGFVRDVFLGRNSKDIDIAVVGSGIDLARRVAKRIGKNCQVSIFKNFGTASITFRRKKLWNIEFVGTRKESYHEDSRKPDVIPGSLSDDQNRRDFTINALAFSLCKEDYGRLIDPFDGIGDIKLGILRTPLEPDITFSDDPLRMMRAARFASQLGFGIHPHTLESVKRNAGRLDIVSRERIMDEFNKILLSSKPSVGLKILFDTGLLKSFFPEMTALVGAEYIEGKGHKDNFRHTLEVVDNLSVNTEDLWLRWAALLHDIGKPATKRFDNQVGWTFHGHEVVGKRMVKNLFKRLKLPLNEKMNYVEKLVALHLRPIALVDEGVSDSALRRLLYEAGDEIEDLMLLCEADITSKNSEKVSRYLMNFSFVRKRLIEVEKKDHIRNFQPPISGELIMQTFGIGPSRQVGLIKTAIKDAILDCKIDNEYHQAFQLMLDEGRTLGLLPIIIQKPE
jgi:putative nucleotidyltransferase with HDIG domain